VLLLGQADSAEAAGDLVTRFRATPPQTVLAAVKAYWSRTLGTLEVRSPDRAFDLMLNRWLLYQTLACRMWARAAFYQASGAYGFRDQLQDSMALVIAQPALAREHLLLAWVAKLAGDVVNRRGELITVLLGEGLVIRTAKGVFAHNVRIPALWIVR
jgi:cellobiose phosphorylase